MPAMVGYLALGSVLPTDPYTFVEAAFSTYARQPAGLDLDPVLQGGAIDTGDPTLRLSNAVAFPPPAAGAWPAVNAIALFAAKTGGAPVLFMTYPPVADPSLPKALAIGALVLTARGTEWRSPLGRPVRGGPVYVNPAAGGSVQIPASYTSLAGALPAP